MRSIVLVTCFVFSTYLSTHELYQECKHHVIDVVATGMPVAFSGLVLWAFFNRIPRHWKPLTGDVAEFIYTSWEQQKFKKARSIALKRIPDNSVFFKVVVFTQELPGVLAIGEPFIKKLEMLLKKRNDLLSALQATDTAVMRLELQKKLQKIDDELDEYRFICGHERVHKEQHHIYKSLLIQLAAPFVVYTFSKMAQKMIHVYYKKDVGSFMVHSTTRSAFEILIGLFYARKFEYDADRLASDDRKIQEAGLRFFIRCNEKQKRLLKKSKDKLEKLLGFCLYYTHPTLQERIILLKRMLA